jgi:hypothetical protein
MNRRGSKILLTLALLAALILCSTLEGCSSSPRPTPEVVLHPPLPVVAAVVPVSWTDRPDLGGLLLPYEQYRKLESNIIEYRREIAELRALAEYYGSGD